MGQEENVLRLLVAEESLNDAEMLISILRNAGHAVRPDRAEDEEDAREQLDQKAFDLFLCSTELGDLTLEQACQLIQQTGKDIPLLALAPTDSPEARRKAIATGAVDLVTQQDLDHLKLVVERELRHLRDRRRLRQLEAAIRETDRRCHALLESSRDAIAYVHEGMHIYANRMYVEKFGFSSTEDVEGMPLLDMASGEHQTKLKEYLRNYTKGKLKDDAPGLELELKGPTGKPLKVRITLSKASIDGEPCTQILIRDAVEEAKVDEKQLQNLASKDGMTGLYNRQYFMTQLDKQIGASVKNDGAGSHGLLYIQLDGVDELRKSLGITTVDTAIAALAKVLSAGIGDKGLIAKFADNAFTVMLPNRGIQETLAFSEAICKRIANHTTEVQGHSINMTASIGVAMLGESGGAQQAVNNMHDAAENARRQGGNRLHLHASADEGAAAKAYEIKKQLVSALKENRFFLVYQPIASLKGLEGERYEVRVRMQSADGEVIMPSEFMNPAEEAGLLPALDRWVVMKAMAALTQQLRAGRNTVMLIKLSSATLNDFANFAKFLRDQLATQKISGKRLIFEINEPVALTQLTQAKEMYKALKSLRCGVALDQFGSGLNPFKLVKHVPADMLKLDRTLTEDVENSEETQQKVAELIETAHELGRQVIAGHLSDITALTVLWQYDTDFVQGYFLQEPEPEMNYDFSGMVV